MGKRKGWVGVVLGKRKGRVGVVLGNRTMRESVERRGYPDHVGNVVRGADQIWVGLRRERAVDYLRGSDGEREAST